MREEMKRIQFMRQINWRIAALNYARGTINQCPPEVRQDPKRAAEWVLTEMRKEEAKKSTPALRTEVRRCEEIVLFFGGKT